MNIPAIHISARPSPLGRMSTQPTTLRGKMLLLLISAVIALLSHILFLSLLPGVWQANQSADYVKYYEPVAEKLASGGGLYLASKPALLYPCGLPIMYAATFAVSDKLHISRNTGLRILEGLLLTLTSVAVSLTALLVLNWRTALVASAMWSTYPFHLWLTKQPDATSLVSLLLLLTVFLFVSWSAAGRKSMRYGSLVGLILGIAALIKPIAIALPALIVGLAWICVIPCRPRQRALFSFCVIVAFLLPISPWEIWARKAGGEWIPLGTNGPNVLIDGLTFGTVRGLKPGWMPQNVRALSRDAVEHYKDLKTSGSIARFMLAKAKEKPLVIAQFLSMKAIRSWYGIETHAFEKWVLLIQLFYLPFVIFGAGEMSRGNRQQKNLLLVVTGMVLYFWSITTFTALPLLRYLVAAVSLVTIPAAIAFDALAMRCLQLLSASGYKTRIAWER